MEGRSSHVSGARGKRSERLCSREERKRRKTSGVVQDGPLSSSSSSSSNVHQRHPDNTSAEPSASYDDRSSAASGLDVADRLTYLEQRMQMQEDEIQLLKLALADVLKRLNISEEHQAASAASAGKRAPGAKARPVSLALPSRAPMVSSSSSVKKSSTLPPGSTARNYSPTPPRSGVKSPQGSVKDSPCKVVKSRPTSAAFSKKTQEGSKSKEAAAAGAGAGLRRVTHCKVTMQIYLSPLRRKTGPSEGPGSAAEVPADGEGPRAAPDKPQQTKGGAEKPETRKHNPSFVLNLQKTSSSTTATTASNSHNAVQETTSSYKSPLKSPSQYFQICY